MISKKIYFKKGIDNNIEVKNINVKGENLLKKFKIKEEKHKFLIKNEIDKN